MDHFTADFYFQIFVLALWKALEASKDSVDILDQLFL